MFKNKSTIICAIVTTLLLVSNTATADITVENSVDVDTHLFLSPCTWTHNLHYNKIAPPIKSVKIEIEAFGVLGCWHYPVYFEGIYLGDLVGNPHTSTQTYTTFSLDDFLTELITGPVSIKIEDGSGVGGVDIGTSTISVTYETEEPLAEPQPEPFTLIVLPNKMVNAIPGQKCVFLVRALDEGYRSGRGETVNLSILEPNLPFDSIVTVDTPAIFPWQVGEITVIPGKVTEIVDLNEPFADRTLTITIIAERKGLTRIERVTVNVTQGQDEYAELASDYRDCFIPWLAVNRPRLGITADTIWDGTIVRPNIVGVNYYLFFSEEWEMGLRWYDYDYSQYIAEIYLRRRDTNLSSTHAFLICSLYAPEEPQVVVLPKESIWR